ncbi:hypothetical protein DFH06DRAFT_758078 [Mycena polygramma]|nr:hypothetical protein DFH06DRAFT_758078 [Mycena polygramma]
MKRKNEAYKLGSQGFPSRNAAITSSYDRGLPIFRRRALDDFYRKAQPLPDYPVWAERGNFAQFLELNEFEIASTCFREEVERYLRNLSNYHQFPLVEDTDKFINNYDDLEEDESKGYGRSIQRPAASTSSDRNTSSQYFDLCTTIEHDWAIRTNFSLCRTIVLGKSGHVPVIRVHERNIRHPLTTESKLHATSSTINYHRPKLL